jgi:hypothetical protein
MSAKQVDITIEQGATFSLNITWKSADGTPVNLTGYTAKMQVRWKYADANALLTFSSVGGTITLGGVAGTISINGAAAVTGVTEPKHGVYDLELTNTSTGFVKRLIQGRALISPEVTR